MSTKRERMIDVEQFTGENDLLKKMLEKAIDLNKRQLAADIFKSLPMEEICKIVDIKVVNVIGNIDHQLHKAADKELSYEYLKHLRDNKLILIKGESKL